MTRTAARGWNAIIPVLVLAALLLQLWIAVRVSGVPRAHAVAPWPVPRSEDASCVC